MLSVRLPEQLETELAAYCEERQMTKSAVVQLALERHIKASTRRRAKADPLLALVGSGNRKQTTDQLMRMTRGADWNKP